MAKGAIWGRKPRFQLHNYYLLGQEEPRILNPGTLIPAHRTGDRRIVGLSLDSLGPVPDLCYQLILGPIPKQSQIWFTQGCPSSQAADCWPWPRQPWVQFKICPSHDQQSADCQPQWVWGIPPAGILVGLKLPSRRSPSATHTCSL